MPSKELPEELISRAWVAIQKTKDEPDDAKFIAGLEEFCAIIDEAKAWMERKATHENARGNESDKEA